MACFLRCVKSIDPFALSLGKSSLFTLPKGPGEPTREDFLSPVGLSNDILSETSPGMQGLCQDGIVDGVRRMMHKEASLVKEA